MNDVAIVHESAGYTDSSIEKLAQMNKLIRGMKPLYQYRVPSVSASYRKSDLTEPLSSIAPL